MRVCVSALLKPHVHSAAYAFNACAAFALLLPCLGAAVVPNTVATFHKGVCGVAQREGTGTNGPPAAACTYLHARHRRVPTLPSPCLQSLAAVPFGSIVIVLLIWMFISFPLCLFGTVVGRNWAGAPDHPCR